MKIKHPGNIQYPYGIQRNRGGLFYLLAAGIIVLLVTFAACKKNNSAGSAAEQEEFASITAESDAEAELIFDNIFDNAMGVSDEVAIGGTGIFGMANPGPNIGEEIVNGAAGADSNTCFTVSYIQATTNRFPLQVVIDFGAGCTGNDGLTRKGKIIITYTGRLVIPGNSATTTFEDYYVNNIHVEGTHKITNTGSQNTKSYTIQVKGAKLSKPNGNFTEWNSEKTISQIEGLGTPLIALDDVFTISGHANGSVKKGDRFLQWATNITEPLTKKFVCRWITKGVITLNKGNIKVAVLDYGTGDCDNKATFTVNGVAHEITLH